MKMTILESAGPLLTKTISAEGIKGYDDAAYFTPRQRGLSGLPDFLSVLDRMRKNPRYCFIRGAPIDAAVAAQVTFQDGKLPLKGGRYLRRAELFTDDPINLLCVDVDGAESDPDQPVWMQCARWIVDNLPEQFHGASFVYHLSSSFGVKPGLRAHLWFWLDQPVTSQYAREWARGWNQHKKARVLDQSIYSSVQVHYTADPIVDDPLGLYDLPADEDRTGLVPGSLHETVPFLDVLAVDMSLEQPEADSWDLLSAKPRLADIDLDDAAFYLSKIPNSALEEKEYDDWLKVGMAIEHQFGDEGLALFHDWGSQSSKYDPHETDRKWASFRDAKADAVTFATIIEMAGGRQVNTAKEDDKYLVWKEKIDVEHSHSIILNTLLPAIVASDCSEMSKALLIEQIRQRVKKLTGHLPPKKIIDAAVERARSAHENLLKVHVEFNLAEAILAYRWAAGKHLICYRGTFWEYVKGLWQMSEGVGAVRHRVQDYIRACIDADNEFSRQIVGQLTQSSDKKDSVATFTNAITNLIANQVSTIHYDPLRMCSPLHPAVINCKNGELHFHPKTGALNFTPHNFANMLTHQISTEYVPFADCPVWDSAIEKVFRGLPACVVEYFYEYLGYVFLGSRNYGEATLLLKGPGSNGKSFVIDIVAIMLGRAAMSLSLADLASKPVNAHFEAGLIGVLALIDDDFKAQGRLPDDWLKKFTGNKTLTANPKYGDTFNFTCRAMCITLSNHWPSTIDLSDGIRRRMNVIELNYRLRDDEKDPAHRTTILEDELPGVLNHIVEGAQRVIRRGRIQAPPEMEVFKSRWLNAGSTAARFVSQMLEITGGEHDMVPAREVFDLYRTYTSHYEDIKMSMGRNKFYESLRNLGIGMTESAHARQMMLWGVKINEEFKQSMMDDIHGAFPE